MCIHTHTTPHIQTNLHLHSDQNRVLLEITGRLRRRRARRNTYVAPHARGNDSKTTSRPPQLLYRTSQTRHRHRSTRRRRREKSGVSCSTKTMPSPPNQAPSGNTDLILPSTNLRKKLEKSIAPNRSLDSSPKPPPPNPPQHKEEPPWRCRHRSRPRRRHQQRSPPNEHHPHELTTEKHISEDMLVGVCRRNKITTTPRRIQHQE